MSEKQDTNSKESGKECAGGFGGKKGKAETL